LYDRHADHQSASPANDQEKLIEKREIPIHKIVRATKSLRDELGGYRTD
jgi:hypothetical protein